VTIIGDYNIGGDAWASRILLEEMGLRVIASGRAMERWPSSNLRLMPSSI
jgi:nitrogenase molybdenum-iron protein alpha/beta subunit